MHKAMISDKECPTCGSRLIITGDYLMCLCGYNIENTSPAVKSIPVTKRHRAHRVLTQDDIDKLSSEENPKNDE